MRVIARDFVELTGFPLLWRWTHEAHSKFTPGELAAIRPIHPSKTATICAQVVSNAFNVIRAEDRIEATTAAPVVRKWLEERVPGGEIEVLLLWGRKTAVVVPRGLFVERWDDFWYASSDDLTVVGIVGTWRIDMHHHGRFEFSASGAVEQGVAPDDRSPPASARRGTPGR